jgi:hypothetical protein
LFLAGGMGGMCGHRAVAPGRGGAGTCAA